MKYVHFITLGCPKNTVDSENMAFLLRQKGFGLTDQLDKADYLIINTCSFINDAKTESVNTILEAILLKEEKPDLKIIVTGCLAQRYADELIEELPEVDVFVGTGTFYDIAELIDSEDKKHTEDINHKIEETDRILTTPSYYAYLKLSEGCDKNCTYCIIPKLRGKQRSRTMEDIISEAERLADKGVRELILIAQDTGEYGTDLYGDRVLYQLLEQLDQVNKIHWIRLLYVYPETIDGRLIETIRDSTKILHYLDIPFQHISDSVLKRMGRGTSKNDIISLIGKLRNAMPDIVIRSSFITGFPGETQEEHRELVDFLREYHLERVGVFTYSREEGTPAAVMSEQISEEVKQERLDELMQIQEEVSDQVLERYLDQFLEVLIEERVEEDVYVGRSYLDAPEIDGVVYVNSTDILEIGGFYNVNIDDSMEYDLIGTKI